MVSQSEFASIYTHGFVRVSACVPEVTIAEPVRNMERIVEMAASASADGARVILFPELCTTGYSLDDLFHQDALLDAALDALATLQAASRSIAGLIVVGVPIRIEGKLYNCAAAIHHGNVLGLIPKLYLPNYREFYEKRQFTSGMNAVVTEVDLFGTSVPFGHDLLFEASTLPGLVVHAEICEDLWAPIPPSTYAAMGGATILCNLSASNSTIGKADYRKDLCAAQSGKMIAAYLYTAAGVGESTTDLAWDGHAIIYENDELLAESERFSTSSQRITADIDLERLQQDRMRMTSFNDSVGVYRERISALRRIRFGLELPSESVELSRSLDRYPFVPNNSEVRAERCFDAYHIQVQGLASRMRATGIEKLVIGVSGGLDSTHALLVAVRAVDSLNLPRENILGFSLPGFATSSYTRDNALTLMRELGISVNEIDIRESALQTLRDIDHPFVDGEPVYDVTFENVQAGARTSLLFRLANHHGGLVAGTGDLSELALGWTTYGVGDQMSHYNVNASVPKTLVQYLIEWGIASGEFGEGTNQVLARILATEISPELIPDEDGSDARPSQMTEEVVGPYELQDFNLYYISRYGFRPSKVAWLGWNAWRDASRGEWPPNVVQADQRAYTLNEIRHWLEVFVRRFFGSSQFKRSAMPNGPKVGSGGSLSPRGDWRAPSDSRADTWIQELHRNLPTIHED